MSRLVISRLLLAVPVLFVVTMATFGLVFLVPGDPAATLAGESATPERIDELRTVLGLDRPVVEQYRDWLGGAVRGELGDSLFRNRPVAELIVERVPVTLALTGFAVLIAVLVAVPAGLVAGSPWQPDRSSDHAVHVVGRLAPQLLRGAPPGHRVLVAARLAAGIGVPQLEQQSH